MDESKFLQDKKHHDEKKHLDKEGFNEMTF